MDGGRLLYPINRWAKLTKHEWALAERLAQKGTYREMAAERRISEGHMKLLARQLLHRLDMNRVQLGVVFAVTKNFASQPTPMCYRATMELPKTLPEALKIIRAQEEEMERLRDQQRDWINLVRDFIADSNANFAHRLHFREGKS